MGRNKKVKHQIKHQVPSWIPNSILERSESAENQDNKVKSRLTGLRAQSNIKDYDTMESCGQPSINKFSFAVPSIPIDNNLEQGFLADKKKVAPRSGLQFKVGPSFDNTTLFKPIYICSTNENVFPFVNARIDRGFDYINGEWIGYKRNYFTLVAAFEFENKEIGIFSREKFYTIDDCNRKVNINCFAIRLVSKCCEDGMQINLVQHTAKRDRGPQFKPPVFPAVSGRLPSHQVIKQAANIRNENKIDQFNKLFFLDSSKLVKVSDSSILSTYPEGQIATVARYERIQFSTSINYRKPTMVNRHFTLQVELLGLLSDGDYTILASTETPPLIVRGRSPSNYQIAKMNAKALLEKQRIDPSFKLEENEGHIEEIVMHGKEAQDVYGEEDEGEKQFFFNTVGSNDVIFPIEKRANKVSISEDNMTCYNNPIMTKQPRKRGRKKGSKSKTSAKKIHSGSAGFSQSNSGIPMVSQLAENIQLNHPPLTEEIHAKQLNIIRDIDPVIKNEIENLINLVDEEEALNLNVGSSLNQFSLQADYNLNGFMEPAVIVKKSKSKKSKSGKSKSKDKHKKERLKNQDLEGDSSFIEFQHELRQLQKELRGEFGNNPNSLISEYIV